VHKKIAIESNTYYLKTLKVQQWKMIEIWIASYDC